MALKIIPKSPASSLPAAVVTVEQVHKGEQVSVAQHQEGVEEAAMANGQLETNCEVGFNAGYTHNLGNFNSTRVGVSLKVPCTHNEINEVYEYTKNWVETRLQAYVDELTGSQE